MEIQDILQETRERWVVDWNKAAEVAMVEV
jgi:hypothetical protein